MRKKFSKSVLDLDTHLLVGLIILVALALTTVLNITYSAIFMGFKMPLIAYAFGTFQAILLPLIIAPIVISRLKRAANLATTNQQLEKEITERQQAEKALAQRARKLRALYQTSLVINAQTNRDALLQEIVDQAVAVTGLHQSTLSLLRADQGVLENVALHNLPDAFLGLKLGLGEGLVGRAAQQDKPLEVEDYQTWVHRQDKDTPTGSRRVLSLPLRIQERLIGVLSIADLEQTGPFSKNEIHLLSLFADQATVAIENARLFEETRQRAEQLETMNEIGHAVSALQDLDAILEIIYRRVQRNVPVDTFFISLYDSQRNQISFPIVYDSDVRYDEPSTPRRPDSWIDRVLNSGKPLLLHRTAQELTASKQGTLGNTDRQSASVLVVPLWQHERVVGVMSVQSYTMDAYTDRHAQILTGIGIQAMIAIENAKLFAAAQQELEERKRVQADLEAKNDELERFTYTVSHDLKSPLITIDGFLSYLEQDAVSGDEERIKNDIDLIRNATAKMQQLLNELLELSRIGLSKNPRQEIALGSLVSEAVDLVSGQLTARGIAIDIAPGMPVIYGDRPRLLQVFQNLLGNAAKFMGNQPQPRIEVSIRNDARQQVICVRDNGIGIAVENQDKIFDLFTKLDPNSEGTGIGLAIIKRIIETHGGKIWVESEGLGYGTTFCFIISTAI